MSRFRFKRGILKALSPALGKLGYAFVGFYPPGKGLLPEGLGSADYLFYEKALPELDASANAVAIQTLTLQNEGWERDYDVTEPTEPSFTEPAG